MSDISQSPQMPVTTDESARGTAIIAYVLYLLGWPTLHLATIVAVVLAYVKRGDVRGTIWESHYDNIINTFWTTLVLGIVFGLLCIVFIGIPLIIALGIWFLYRAIKGLVRAIDNRPYS
jgi:uncharacterized membrane protein